MQPSADRKLASEAWSVDHAVPRLAVRSVAATGDLDNPDKRLWPIRTDNYWAAREILAGLGEYPAQR